MQPAELLNAGAVAVVGASESRHYPRSVIRNLLALGFPPERILPVNPGRREVFGLPCHPSLSALPQPVPLVLLATRRETVCDLVAEAARAGARAAVVLADGFAEQGAEGAALQERLASLAREAGIALLGPNTLGFVAPWNGLGVWAGGELPGPVRRGGVAFVFQSSGMLNLVLSLVCHRQIGLRAAVSVGNEAGLQAADFVAHFAGDERAAVIVALLETTDHPAPLSRALHAARAAGKPVVVLKLGRSERARRNALAHTGRMSGSGLAWEALLERLGAVLVEDLDELVEAAALFEHRRPLPAGGGLGICTISGGDCGLLSDLAERLGVPLPEVAEDTRRTLVDALGKSTVVGNPLDCESLRREDAGAFNRCIGAFCRDPALGVVAFRMNLAPEPTAGLTEMYGELFGHAADCGRMPVVLSRAAEPLGSGWFRFFAERGVALLPSYRTALQAVGRLLDWSARGEPDPGGPPPGVPEVLRRDEGAARILSWSATQQWLAAAGVPYVPSRLAADGEEAVAAAEALGWPVALKLVAAGVAHKSDAGGVRLGLRFALELREACAAMARGRPGGSVLQGFEVQAMVAGGVEVLLGMTWEPAVGPVLMLGAGGVLTEALRDVVLAVPPLTEGEVLGLLGRLRVSAVLRGGRGRPRADVEALAALVARFSRFVVRDWPDLREVDLNPVLVLPAGQGVVAVDALVALRGT